jgi:hypothetical protein
MLAVALPATTATLDVNTYLHALAIRMQAMCDLEPQMAPNFTSVLAGLPLSDAMAWTESASSNPLASLVERNTGLRDALAAAGVTLGLPATPTAEMLEDLGGAAPEQTLAAMLEALSGLPQ